MSQHILRLPEVLRRTGLSRSTIYAMLKDETFPQPIGISARGIGWTEDLIQQWYLEGLERRAKQQQRILGSKKKRTINKN